MGDATWRPSSVRYSHNHICKRKRLPVRTVTSIASCGLAASPTISALAPEFVSAPDRVRDELLAATAHELRLPLSHIKGFVSSLRRTDVQWDEATRRDFLADIEVDVPTLRGYHRYTARTTQGPPGGDRARRQEAAGSAMGSHPPPTRCAGNSRRQAAPVAEGHSHRTERTTLGRVCELCGSQEQVEVHHIRKLRDLRRPGKGEPSAWVRQMAARQRKPLVVCWHCHHHAIHGRQVKDQCSRCTATDHWRAG